MRVEEVERCPANVGHFYFYLFTKYLHFVSIYQNNVYLCFMVTFSGFDGMSCGRLALDKLRVPVDEYFTSEIDKHAIKFVGAKWPNTKQLGSITEVRGPALPAIDLFIGGSPCQGFSYAGKGLNFNDPRSALFFEYVRVLDECRQKNPEIEFMLENVAMKKEHEDIISRILGVQPININSSLVSAQNRERLYWTNIANIKHGLFGDNHCTIQPPKDKRLFLKDILQENVPEKYFLSDAAIISMRERKQKNKALGKGFGAAIRSENEKSPTISARYYKDGSDCLIIDSAGRIRRLTPVEVCRLQTVPDNYFFNIGGGQIVSDTQIYKMCGNGWTVDVIAHIFKHIPTIQALLRMEKLVRENPISV